MYSYIWVRYRAVTRLRLSVRISASIRRPRDLNSIKKGRIFLFSRCTPRLARAAPSAGRIPNARQGPNRIRTPQGTHAGSHSTPEASPELHYRPQRISTPGRQQRYQPYHSRSGREKLR